MADTVENIDELISYIESPEYLRMVAQSQGESPYSLLGSEFPPVEEPEDDEDSPEQIVFENLDTEPEPLPVASAFGIRWNPTTQMCDCLGCAERRIPILRRHAPRPIRRLRARDTLDNFADVLTDRQAFRTGGALRGCLRPEASSSGQLSGKSMVAHALWCADQNVIDYVVYSYFTPIAWHVTTPNGASEWIYPDVRYSRTTSGHQNKIKSALSAVPGNLRVIEGD